MVARLFHVSSVKNRDSIMEYGLDWSRMSASSGIAGSRHPEEEGCFMCLTRDDCDFFIYINNTGGRVDVWAVDGIDELELTVTGQGFSYFPGEISPKSLTLVERDLDRGDLGAPYNS